MLKGIAVSPGVAVGTAYCIHEIFVTPDARPVADVSAEFSRYENAREAALAELKALERKVASQVGPEEAAIFSAHQSILRDPGFQSAVRRGIVDDRLTAPAVLQRLLEQYTEFFHKLEDEYLRERMNDVRDVIIRISAHLSEVLRPDANALRGPLIVVANELLPSQAVTLGGIDVRGIVTQSGSQTSHAAIVARSRGIPAVAGVKDVLSAVKTGVPLIVDGREGLVLVHPDAEQRSAYLKLEREFFVLKDQLAANREKPAVTADGESLELLANINGEGDATAACAMGASGVGLFRTEYVYLTHPSVPDEEEQLAAYEQAIVASPKGIVTIRTLDIGGDKTVPYLGHTHQEANPFMGWRSIRLSFEHPALFRTQIRAILRAAATAEDTGRQVRIMFPMITALEEIRAVRGFVDDAAAELKRERKPFREAPLGMMVEVPAAAVSIHDFFSEVDFISVGSNDLVQYLMAADRDNPKVTHLCQPLAPPVLRILSMVVRTANRAKKPITLCGEMAGQPRAFVLLFGMGLRNFSMSPAFIPSIKELAGKLSREHAHAILRRAMTLRTTARVQEFMAEQIRELAPDVAKLDTA